MSRVSISKSYAVLIGLEGYSKTRKKLKKVGGDVKGTKDKTLHPEEVARVQEEKRDKTESAEKERRTLEKIDENQGEDGLGSRLLKKLHIAHKPVKPDSDTGTRTSSIPADQRAENAIPS